MATHEKPPHKKALEDDRDRPFSGILAAADVAYQEGDGERAEQAVLLALSHARKVKDGAGGSDDA